MLKLTFVCLQCLPQRTLLASHFQVILVSALKLFFKLIETKTIRGTSFFKANLQLKHTLMGVPKPLMCNTGFLSFISNVSLNFIQKTHPEGNEDFYFITGFVCCLFYAFTTSKVYGIYLVKKARKWDLASGFAKCFVTVVSSPCFLWNLAHTSQDPYLRHLFLPQNDREWKKQENLKACVLFPSQVRETKKERNLPGEQDNSQHTRLIV